MEKINDDITFEPKLNIKKFTVDKNNKDVDTEKYEYEYIGVIIHSGTAQSGHYYSIIQTNVENVFNGTDTATAILISNSTANQKSTIVCEKTDTNKQIEFGVGAGGVNRGIFDEGQQKWLFYTDDTNTYINSSGTTYIDGKNATTLLDDSGWVNCTTSQGTWNFCQVRKIGKVVHLRAFASSLGRPNGAVFTIPSGYRPSQQEVFYASAGFSTGYTIVRTYINTDGSVGMDWNINMGTGQDVTANTWKRFDYTYFVD